LQGYEQLGPVAAAVGQIGPGLAIVAGIFGVIATLLQWVIMIVRATVLPLLVAIWPVAAAAAMIRGAEQSFSKVTMWLVAFLLYKPIAAIIYAFAWKLKSGGDGIGGVINGMLLLVLAVAALPALMKLLSPATAAMGSAAGGSMATGGRRRCRDRWCRCRRCRRHRWCQRWSQGRRRLRWNAGPSGGAATAQGTTSMAAPESSSGTAPGGAPAGPSGNPASSNPGGAVAPGGSGGSNAGTGSGGASTGRSSAGGAVAKGASGGNAGLQAATQSLGGSVAQGAKNTDGKDVLGS
jgi:type IV secretion system protein TrbL